MMTLKQVAENLDRILIEAISLSDELLALIVAASDQAENELVEEFKLCRGR